MTPSAINTAQGGWLAASTAVYHALIRPARYFRETSSGDLFRNFLAGTVSLLILAAVLIFLAALFSADSVRETGREVMSREGLRPEDLPFALQPAAPISRLAFPVYWIVALVYLALVRWGVLALYGAREATFLRSLAISGHAALGMMLAAALLGIANRLFPITPDTGASLGRVLFALFLFGFGWLLEGRAWIAGGRELFELSRWPAIAVWLSPIFAGVVLLALTAFALLVLAGGGSL